MTKAAPKLTLAPPQTMPLDKLALHEGNVRQIKAGVSIESLAADMRSASAFGAARIFPSRTAPILSPPSRPAASPPWKCWRAI